MAAVCDSSLRLKWLPIFGLLVSGPTAFGVFKATGHTYKIMLTAELENRSCVL